MYVFTEESERKTLISNSQMKSLWDKYQELLKSKYLEVFFPERTKQEIAKMLGKKITEMSEQEIAEMCEDEEEFGW